MDQEVPSHGSPEYVFGRGHRHVRDLHVVKLLHFRQKGILKDDGVAPAERVGFGQLAQELDDDCLDAHFPVEAEPEVLLKEVRRACLESRLRSIEAPRGVERLNLHGHRVLASESGRAPEYIVQPARLKARLAGNDWGVAEVGRQVTGKSVAHL